MEHLGQHVIIDLWGCNDGINDAETVKSAMLAAVKAANATLLSLDVHTFSPQGVTGVAVLTESHLSIHSWPEHGYLAADIFTCGNTTKPVAAAEALCQYFHPTHVDVHEIIRGQFPERGQRPRLRKPALPWIKTIQSAQEPSGEASNNRTPRLGSGRWPTPALR